MDADKARKLTEAAAQKPNPSQVRELVKTIDALIEEAANLGKNTAFCEQYKFEETSPVSIKAVEEHYISKGFTWSIAATGDARVGWK